MLVDFKGRIEVTATPAAIEYLEKAGKRIVMSFGDECGLPTPTLTVEDWPAIVDGPKLHEPKE